MHSHAAIIHVAVGMAISYVVLKPLRMALALAAGVAVLGLSCHGKPAPPAKPVLPVLPPAKIISSSITPAGTIHFGDTVRATTRLDPPVCDSEPYLICRDLSAETDSLRSFMLFDDGSHGDQTARDGNWTLELAWAEDCGAGPRIGLSLELHNSTDDIYIAYGTPVAIYVEPFAEQPVKRHVKK
jgi:hypothetical protein